MDIGLDHGTINANLATLLNVVVFGVLYDTAIDQFPGLRGQGFDVLAQH